MFDCEVPGACDESGSGDAPRREGGERRIESAGCFPLHDLTLKSQLGGPLPGKPVGEPSSRALCLGQVATLAQGCSHRDGGSCDMFARILGALAFAFPITVIDIEGDGRRDQAALGGDPQENLGFVILFDVNRVRPDQLNAR